jgi:hypothetical protein
MSSDESPDVPTPAHAPAVVPPTRLAALAEHFIDLFEALAAQVVCACTVGAAPRNKS